MSFVKIPCQIIFPHIFVANIFRVTSHKRIVMVCNHHPLILLIFRTMVWYRNRNIRISRSQRLHYQNRSIRNGMSGINFQDALHELGRSWKFDNGDGITRTWAHRLPLGAAWEEQNIGMKVAWHELALAKLVPGVTRGCSTWATGAGNRDMTWAATKIAWIGMTWENMSFGVGNHEFWHEITCVLAWDGRISTWAAWDDIS